MAPPAPRRPPSPRDSDWQLQTADGPAMTPRAACPDSSPVRVRGLVVNAKLVGGETLQLLRRNLDI